MNFRLRKFIFFLICWMSVGLLMAQTTYYYDGSGNMNSTTNWGTNTNGGGSDPPNFTSANQIFEIRNTTAVTISYNWTVSGAGSKVVLGNVGEAAITLSHTSGDFEATFDIAQAISGTNTYNVSVSNTNRIPNFGTLHASSTVNYSRNGSMNVKGATYGNLTISGSSTKTAIADFGVTSTLTINSGLVLDMATFQLTDALSTAGSGTLRTQNTSATPLPSGTTWNFTVEYNGTTQTVVNGTYETALTIGGTGDKTGQAIEVNGTFTINTGRTLNMGTNVLSGNPTSISGTGTLTTQSTINPAIPSGESWTCTVNYNGVAQTVEAGTYTALTIAGSGTKTGEAFTVNGVFTISSGTILDMGSNTLSGNPTSTSGTGTLQTESTANPCIPSRETWAFTVEYNGASQTVEAGTYSTGLTISGSGSKTAEAITVNGVLTIHSGAILDMGTLTLSGNPTSTSGTGVLQTQSTANPCLPSGETWAFTVEYNGGAQTVEAGTYTTGLTIAGSGDKTGEVITVNGNLTINSGRILNMGTNVLSGTVTSTSGTGTLRTQNTTATPVPTGKTWTFTLEYNSVNAQTVVNGFYTRLNGTGGNRTLQNAGTISISEVFTVGAGTYTVTGSTVDFNGATQNIPAFTFNNLTISGSDDKTATGTINVNGVLTINASLVLNMGTNLLGGNPTSTSGSGTLQTQNTSNPAIPTNETWAFTVEYNGGTQTVEAGTYSTGLIISGSGDKTGEASTVNGILTINAGRVLNMGTNLLSGNPTSTSGTGTLRTQNLSATPIPAGETWTFTIEYNSGSAQTVVNGFYTRLNGTGGNRTLQNSGTISISEIFTVGAGTYTVTGSTVDFNGATQNIPAFTFNNLTISGSGDKTATGTVNVNGVFTINASRVLNMGTNLLGGNPTSTSGSGTLQTQNTSNPAIPTGETWAFTVEYNGGTQTVEAGTYSTGLTISGSGDKTGEAITVNGVLTINTGRLLNMGTNLLSGNPSSTSGTGTLQTQNTSANPIPSGESWSFTVIYNGAAQSVVPATYTNLTISGSGEKAMTGDVTISGTLDIAAGTYRIGAGNTLTLNGQLTGVGTITAGSCGASPLPNLNIGGTGALGTLSLTLGGRTLANFELNRTSSGTVTMATPLNIAGTLTLTEGALVTDNRLAFHTSNTPITRTSGTITLSSNTVLIFGNCDQAGTAFTLPNGLFTSPPTINELWIDRTNGVTLGNQMISVSNVVTVTNNASLTTNGMLTLLSSASSTARVAAMSGSAAISGDVVVQRHIPSSGRRYRFLSSPVSNTTLLDWQNEIYVTGIGTGNTLGTLNSNGFDATASNNGSIFYYNESLVGGTNTGWTEQTNNTLSLNNVPLVVGRGYRVFIRGDRSNLGRLDGTLNTQNEVVMNLVGEINQGNVVLPVSYTNNGTPSSDGWNLIGNPYPSGYDWNAFWDAGNSGDDGTHYTNIASTVYIYDASAGSYKSYNAFSNTGTFNGVIASGQSFFLKATAASPALTFVESFKTSTTPTSLFKNNNHDDIVIRLKRDSVHHDDCILQFNQRASVGSDLYDIPKLLNGFVDISLFHSSDQVFKTADVRPYTTQNDTAFINFSGAQGNYVLSIESFPTLRGKTILLVDQFTKRREVLYQGLTYSFSITADPLTRGTERMMLVILNNSSLPVNMLSFSGKVKQNHWAQLNWDVVMESNLSHYTVERSEDGFSFRPIGQVKAKGVNGGYTTYVYHDDIALSAKGSYYRIVSTDIDQSTQSSETIFLHDGQFEDGPTLFIQENPVHEKLQLGGSISPNQIQQLIITDYTGKVVCRKQVEADLKIDLSTLKSGVYFAHVTTQGKLYTLKFIKQ